MPSASELIAHGKEVAEIQQAIAADWLIFQDLEDLIETAREGNPDIKQFDASVFNGHYVTGDIDQNYLNHLESKRNDYAKQDKDSSGTDNSTEGETMIGLHNAN